MADIWQWNDKNSNKSLKQKKIIVLELCRSFCCLLGISSPKSNICSYGCISNKETPFMHLKNEKKNRWNGKYSIVFAGSVSVADNDKKTKHNK